MAREAARLAREPKQIHIGTVIRGLESDFTLVECTLATAAGAR